MMGAGDMPAKAGYGSEASGTALLPDLTPMQALHHQVGAWELMLHGNVFAQYLYDGGYRGLRQFGSVNWFMGMVRRPVAGGPLTLRGMFSLERLTVGRCGYPNLFATGELCYGQPIHDQQHPHNLFMELAVRYERPVVAGVGIDLYGAVSGEPALGPVAFPHRLSALPNPLSPIGHHWMDATHISFGVVTVGVSGRRWKLEASRFNGREPGEERYGIYPGPLDSYSGRIWLLPDEHWSFQVSAGHLRKAQPILYPVGSPRADVNRSTVSATHHRMLGKAFWATTAVWGRNTEAHPATPQFPYVRYFFTKAFLLESSLNVAERDVFFGRAELAWKQGEDLALFGTQQHQNFKLGKLQAGYTRQFGVLTRWRLAPGLGASVSLSLVPPDLVYFYVQPQPLGFAVFGSLRPAAMEISMHEGH